MKQTIALIDDDRNILTSISIALEKEGFKVQTYLDGESALIGLTRQPPDLAIIDIKMPKMDGMELLRQIRKKSNLPVIFLTTKNEEIDELMGLQMGADDYITQPASNRLLIQRINALVRRIKLLNEATDTEETSLQMRRGSLLLDEAKHSCTWKEQPVTLTVTEFLILSSLANHPGHVRSRDQLLDAAFDGENYVSDRTIDSHIKRLRKKFKMYDSSFDQIRTRYGSGYSWRE